MPGRHPRHLLALLCVSLVLTACTPPVDEEHIFDVAFSEITSGSHSQITIAKQLLIRSQHEWDHLWRAHSGNPIARRADIDFDTEMAIALFLGQRPTGGYALRVQRIHQRQGRLLVEAVVQRPVPGLQVTLALTQPFTIIKLPRYDLPVHFMLR